MSDFLLLLPLVTLLAGLGLGALVGYRMGWDAGFIYARANPKHVPQHVRLETPRGRR